jgi:hypothetical protein
MVDAPNEGVLAILQAEASELVSQLDREIEELRRLSPPGYERTIIELRDTVLAIHDAIETVRLDKGR